MPWTLGLEVSCRVSIGCWLRVLQTVCCSGSTWQSKIPSAHIATGSPATTHAFSPGLGRCPRRLFGKPSSQAHPYWWQPGSLLQTLKSNIRSPCRTQKNFSMWDPNERSGYHPGLQAGGLYLGPGRIRALSWFPRRGHHVAILHFAWRFDAVGHLALTIPLKARLRPTRVRWAEVGIVASCYQSIFDRPLLGKDHGPRCRHGAEWMPLYPQRCQLTGLALASCWSVL